MNEVCQFCDNENITLYTPDKRAGTTVHYDGEKRMIISGFITMPHDNIPYGVACCYKINYCPFCGKELKEDERPEEN